MPPDPRNYLRDRGLADDPPAGQPAPFRVNLETGEIVSADPGVTQLQAPGLPDDYAARLVALETARMSFPYPVGEEIRQSERAHWPAEVRRIAGEFLAFLTANEKPEPDETLAKSHIFTDT